MKCYVNTKSRSNLQSLHIGIMGGGQLARMLILSAHRMGISTTLFCYSADEPAAQVTSHFYLVKSKPPYFSKSHYPTLSKLTHLTFESEFFDIESMRPIFENLSTLNVYPHPDIMYHLQHRCYQKKLLDIHGVPTSPWRFIESCSELNFAFESFYREMVIKKVLGGYDGNGTFICKSPSALKKVEPLLKTNKFIAEEFQKFKRELATLVVRSASGHIQILPLVETFQTHGRCDWVKGPIDHPDWPSFKHKLKHFVEQIEYVGVIAFELFDTPNGLLVNEMAPRVHNSGHYSQEALNFSQFDLHLLSALNCKLPEVRFLHPSFAMINLIGSGVGAPVLPCETQGVLHWYGKSECRLGRKMGHLNYVGSKPSDTKRLVTQGLKERKYFKL